MRTNSVITGLALALTLGATGVASAQGVASPDRPRDAQDSGFRRGAGGRGGAEATLLRGITLTPDQQAQLKDLRDRGRQQMDAERSQHDRGGNEARSQRQPGDTAGMGARRAQLEQRRDQRIAALRGILNADQQVQFDKNVAEMKAHAGERGHEGGPERPDQS
jgi:Spy/CpxP family protein refolding chaperone